MRERVAAVAILISTAAPLASAAVIEIEQRGANGALSCKGRVILERNCSTECEPVVELPLAAGTTSRVNSSLQVDGGALRLRVESSDCWARTLDLPADASIARIEIWRAATVRGKLFAAENGELLRLPFTLRFRRDPAAVFETQDEARCVRADEVFTCTWPEQSADLRLESEGYVPVYANTAELRRDALWDIRLKRGASLRGRVVAYDGRLLDAVLKLTPKGSATSDVAAAVKTKPDVHGFYQFSGIEPGQYDLSAVRPNASPAYVSGIVITDPREYEQRDLLLAALSRLDVFVTPPADHGNKRWRIQAFLRDPIQGNLAPIKESFADFGGTWSATAIPQGEYRLVVADSSGSVMRRETVRIDAPSASMGIVIEAIRVRGRITAGDRPLEAELRFVWKDGGEISMKSDAEGEFEGVVPHEGQWRLEITLAASAAKLNHGPVTIARREGEAVAQLEIDIPRGRISGRVVEQSGTGRAAAVTIVSGGSPVANFLTDKEGVFDVIGLEPGEVTLWATSEEARSADTHALIEVDEAAAVELRLLPERIIRGIVAADDGRLIAGATVRAFTSLSGTFEQTFTGPSGQFVLRGLAPEDVAVLVVFAEGFAIRMLTIQPGDRTLEIHLGRFAGIAAVRFGEAPPWPDVQHSTGPKVPLNLLIFPEAWTRMTGGVTVRLQPGDYQFCAERTGCRQQRLSIGERILIDMTVPASKEGEK